MTETNYQRGARYERRIQKLYEEAGAVVVRSAASKSPLDLVVFFASAIPILIQVKSTKGSTPVSPMWDADILALLDDGGVELEWWCWVGGRHRWASYINRYGETRGPFYLTTAQAREYIANGVMPAEAGV